MHDLQGKFQSFGLFFKNPKKLHRNSHQREPSWNLEKFLLTCLKFDNCVTACGSCQTIHFENNNINLLQMPVHALTISTTRCIPGASSSSSSGFKTCRFECTCLRHLPWNQSTPTVFHWTLNSALPHRCPTGPRAYHIEKASTAANEGSRDVANQYTKGKRRGLHIPHALREIQGHKQDHQTIPNLKVVLSAPGVSGQPACSVILCPANASGVEPKVDQIKH